MNPDVQRFIGNIPADHKPDFMRLHDLILEMYPDAQLVISYGVPTFKTPKGWVALGHWKGGVSVYPRGRRNTDVFRAENPGFKTGAGTINLRTGEPLPIAALRKVIRLAMESPKGA